MEVVEKTALKGGEFLIQETPAQAVFIPEDFNEEQRMMAQACYDFLRTEIYPNIDRMDGREPGFMVQLMNKAGELGLLGISVPHEYGGLGMSFNSSMLVADVLGAAGSFSTAFGAHTGIGTLPILYYGNEAQKQAYLPKLASGEWKAAYCLTEPDAGSDANSGKTKARLSADGTHYLITGQKMWISNAGFADLFIVFAKIDDDKNLTAFIVEKTYGGITMNDEEKKLGIKGSSTRQVFFNDCPVPVANMLSTRGNGFKIAVNILNIGRIKLAAAVIGAAKEVMGMSVNYANERKQFGQTIANFGAIKQKIAQMAAYTYATESAAYRAGQNIEDNINALIAEGMPEAEAKLKGVEQFAIECAIMKVHGSEVLDFVVDESLQIYGGMGFSEEAPMARAYRDSRITRIYEGTNEINRMLLVGMILKRAMAGQLDVLGPAMAVAKELTSVPSFATVDASVLFAEEKEVIRNLKKAILMVAGKAAQTFGPGLDEQQELLMHVADMIIETYVAESALLRTEKLVDLRGQEACQEQLALARLYLHHAVDQLTVHGKEAINAFATGDEQRVMLMGLKRFTKINPLNTVATGRQIADHVIAQNKYPF
ncbi:MAG: acyl-CoA dehydrogenase family protein [Bernardetiaceae bacterium]|jgi:alkylation response protein AidB-like acyl-CoA dehydrogenase|nr:acyl-CoA dehydrogenase family protein [Bernardetiaceae bacterium]